MSDGDGGNVGAPVSDAGNQGAPAAPVTFTQDQLNAKLAEHKRNLQRQLEATAGKAQAFDKLQAQVSELIQKGGFEGVEDLGGFAERFEATLNETRSKEEQAKSEAQKLKAALESAQKEANEVKSRWQKATIDRAIGDEAGPRAVSAGAAELVRMKLAADAIVKDDGTVVIKQTLKNEEGKTYTKEVPVKEAVGQLEADVANYGSLFKATVNSGAGGAVDGIRRTPEGAVDFSTMTFEKFMELSKKAPDVLAKSLASLTR